MRADPDDPGYASRGGHKLAGALAAFEPAGPRASPAAAAWTRAPRPAASPTCCCAPGRGEVVAVDVGYGQLVWTLQTRPPGPGARPHQRPRDRPRARSAAPVDLVVGDLSFISLELVLDALIARDGAGRRPGADGQAAVRGRQGAARQGRRGPRPRAAGRRRRGVADAARRRGWGARAVTTSPLPGPVGQRRVLRVAARRRPGGRDRDAIEAEVARSADVAVPGEKVNP